MSNSEKVTIRTFGTRIEAEITKTKLDSEGIESWILSDDAGGAYPQLQTQSGVRLQVDISNYDHATALISDQSEAMFPEIDEEEESIVEVPAHSGPGWLLLSSMLVMGFIGGHLAAPYMTTNLKPGIDPYANDDEAVAVDENNDGKTDQWWWYESGVLTEMQEDYDFDGIPDNSFHYLDGVISSSALDTDNDSEHDLFEIYENARISLSYWDQDEDGITDTTSYYQYGQIVSTVVHPSGGKITSLYNYSNGMLKESYSDPATNGKFLKRWIYDKYGQIVTSERVP